MAKRYSGTLELTIKYIDATDTYTVRIREVNDAARFAPYVVGLAPVYCGTPRDSSAAFDLIAEAALGFALNEDEAVSAYAASDTDTGEFIVSRKRA